MKIAVIGSGISGLSSAYFLSKKYKVDLFEKNDHFGGHSFTYEIKEGDKIRLSIYNVKGEMVRTLVNSNLKCPIYFPSSNFLINKVST